MQQQLGQMVLATVCTMMIALAGCSSSAADAPSGPPASPAEAAKVIDLSSIALYDGATDFGRRRLATLGYDVMAEVKQVFEFHRKQLVGLGWKELEGGYVSEQSATGIFARGGFRVSVSVIPTGKPSVARVNLANHGNVATEKLPVPAGAKVFFAGPTSAMFITETPVDKVAEECRKLLQAAGWQPYGKAGESWIYKQNAIRLNAYITAAPAQGGKTMMTYSTELMSVDLPAPAETIGLQYADSTTELMFDSQQSPDEIFGFYRTTLAKSGWQATLDHAIEFDKKPTVIFRNPAMDMLTLQVYHVEGINRVVLKHQSAAEVAELERLIEEEKARRKAKAP